MTFTVLESQEAGLKVKEYELLRKNFSDGGNFGTLSPPSLSPLCCTDCALLAENARK